MPSGVPLLAGLVVLAVAANAELPSPPAPACFDHFDWTDRHGTTCAKLAEQNRCADNALTSRLSPETAIADVEGTGRPPAHMACCACGRGREQPVCVDHFDWTDKYDTTCATLVEQNRCADNALTSRLSPERAIADVEGTGRPPAHKACCACGRGQTAAPTAAPTSAPTPAPTPAPTLGSFPPAECALPAAVTYDFASSSSLVPVPWLSTSKAVTALRVVEGVDCDEQGLDGDRGFRFTDGEGFYIDKLVGPTGVLGGSAGPGSDYTVAITFRFDNESSSSYKRVLNTADDDHGLYIRAGAVDPYPHSAGDGRLRFGRGAYHTLVLSFEAGTGYEAGTVRRSGHGNTLTVIVQQEGEAAARGSTWHDVSDAYRLLRDKMVFFNDDDDCTELHECDGGEAGSGHVKRIQVWDRVLTPREAVQAAAAPPICPESTAAPTSAPTAVSTVTSATTTSPVCADDGNWFVVKRKKSCAWAGAKPRNRCGKSNAMGLTGYEACPLSCGRCKPEPDTGGGTTCANRDDWTYKKKWNRGLEGCSWIGLKTHKRCSMVGTDGVAASTACPMHCDPECRVGALTGGDGSDGDDGSADTYGYDDDGAEVERVATAAAAAAAAAEQPVVVEVSTADTRLYRAVVFFGAAVTCLVSVLAALLWVQLRRGAGPLLHQSPRRDSLTQVVAWNEGGQLNKRVSVLGPDDGRADDPVPFPAYQQQASVLSVVNM